MSEPEHTPQFPNTPFPWHLTCSGNEAELIAGLADWFGVESDVVLAWLRNPCMEEIDAQNNAI